jgi:hypothetical protein
MNPALKSPASQAIQNRCSRHASSPHFITNGTLMYRESSSAVAVSCKILQYSPDTLFTDSMFTADEPEFELALRSLIIW